MGVSAQIPRSIRPYLVPLGKQCVICMISLFTGFLLSYAGFLNMRLTSKSEAIMKVFVMVMVTIGFALSVQFRCIILNVIPSIIGSAGRSYIWVIIIGLLIEGPIANMHSNWTELSLSFSCYFEVIQNMTMVSIELMTRPERQALGAYKENQQQLTKTVRKLHNILGPMDEEVTGVKEQKRIEGKLNRETINRINRKYPVNKNDPQEKQIESNYKRKLEYRCEDMYHEGILQCKRKFHNLYNKCRHKIAIVGVVLCLPLKLDKLCNILKLFPKLAGSSCNDLNGVGDGIGDKYVSCKSSQSDLMKEFDVNMDSEVTMGNLTLYKKMMSEMESAASETRVVVSNTLKEKDYFRRLFFFLCHLLAFYTAIAYQKGYISDIQHENNYINNRFRQIDCNRAAAGKKVVHLLKKHEKREIIEIDSVRLLGREKRRMAFNLLIFILVGVVISSVFCLDYILYKFISLNTKHFDIESTHTGHHALSPHVKGKGLLGLVVRKMMKGLNQSSSVNKTFSTHSCRPRLTQVKTQKEFGTWMAIILAFIVFEPYFFRIRVVLCGWCYPEIEILRAKYLYRVMLQKRIASR